MLVAPDVDALCAARMLADIFKQDDVMHRIIPVSGQADFQRVKDELLEYSEVCDLAITPMLESSNRFCSYIL